MKHILANPLGGMGRAGLEGDGKDMTQRGDRDHGNHLSGWDSAASSLPTSECLSDCASQCLVRDHGHQTRGCLPPTHSCSESVPD